MTPTTFLKRVNGIGGMVLALILIGMAFYVAHGYSQGYVRQVQQFYL